MGSAGDHYIVCGVEAVPVYGGEGFQQVHVHKCAGEIERVRELVTEIDKLDDLCVKEGRGGGKEGEREGERGEAYATCTCGMHAAQ